MYSLMIEIANLESISIIYTRINLVYKNNRNL